MLSCFRGSLKRSLCAAVAAVSMGVVAGSAQAQDESAYSFSFGADLSSHFISYGADVWGGGASNWEPLNSSSTAFAYGTMNIALTDQLTAFVNVWNDLNDNVDSAIGGPIQEIDVNVGLTYTWEQFAFTVMNGYWIYAGDEEKIADFVVGYTDDWIEGVTLNPSFVVHWRYDGNGGQDEGVVLQAGLKPTFTLNDDSQYPVTLFFPVGAAWISDDFHGGDSGFGYAFGGVGVSVPLAFIPAKYGAWSAGVSATYWYTPDDVIPGNPNEEFLVTSATVGVSF